MVKPNSPRRARRQGKSRAPARITLRGVGLFLLLYGTGLALLGLATGNFHTLTPRLDVVVIFGGGVTALIAGQIASPSIERSDHRVGAGEIIALVAAVITLTAALLPFLGPIGGSNNPSGYDEMPLLPCQEPNEPLPTRSTADS
jgi:hypothetical protein